MERPNSKFGIYGFAYITNSSSFIDELNAIIYNDNAEFQRFNKYFHTNVTLGNNIVFLDKFGNKKDRQNNTVIKSNAFYAIYDTGFKLANANIIYGIFSRKTLLNTFEGIEFGDDRKLKEIIQERLRFKIGLIHFDYDDHSWEDGFDFIEDLYSTAIPENWSYYKQSSSIPHPILKSYIEYIFTRLTKEKNGSKLIIDDNKKFVLFNSGLLNIFFKPIYIIVELKSNEGREYYANPFILRKRTVLSEIGFTINGKIVSERQLPDPAQFYENISEIIFKPEPEFFDPDDDKLFHIIEDRIYRFPESYQARPTTELAVLLDTAIKCSYELAKRNYKLVVPQYRPQKDKIQYLMPIYLGATFNKQPDFALVLDYDGGYYKPETILDLDDAYQNARLIARPDNFWLSPEQI